MKKILIVDDIETNRKLLRQMLVSFKIYDVYEAVDGEDALNVYKNENPDLILMDINMPNMNGYESATSIKNLCGDTYTPIIFVTALDSEITLINALFSGGDDYIGKPFNIDVLQSKIKAHLRIRELNQQLNEKNIQLVHEQNLIEHFFESALKQSYLDENIIKYHMSPMSIFNGDILLVERAPHGGLYLLMGDFTGHGLTAAMGTLPTAMIFFSMTQKGLSVSDIARELNFQLNKLLPTGMFLAATLLELNSQGNMISVWMGGMPESYWLDSSGDLKDVIKSQHMPLGILKDKSFDDKTSILKVAKNDKLYFYSDGLTESLSPDNIMFGNDRLRESVVINKVNRFDSILTDLQSFTGSIEQTDDLTLVEMTCCEIPEVDISNNTDIDNSIKFPCKLSVSLTEKEMREHDPVAEISEILSGFSILYKHLGIIHMLLSEMYSNALEHSILGLDSDYKSNEENFAAYYRDRDLRLLNLSGATIDFDFEIFAVDGVYRLKITLKDNGNGFSSRNLDKKNDCLHGRGLTILNSICESVKSFDDGRAIEVLYVL